jgi:mRNA-degrading endonuclease RelE of RelBE toxin-antitoxin system
MYERKGTRELYIKPYRIAYAYSKEEDKITFLEIYHKDEQ